MVKRAGTAGIPMPDLASLCLAITNHAPLPMATIEGASRLVRYGNPAFCKLMGKPLEKLVGIPFDELLPEKDQCITLMERVARTRSPESYTEQDASRPHPVFWSYTIWPVMEDAGLIGVMIQVTETSHVHGQTVAMNQALMLGSLRQHELTAAAEILNAKLRDEIAERKQVEIALRDSESRFRILFESSPMAVFVCNQDGVILHHNTRATELWGGAPGFWFEKHCESVKMWHPEGQVLPPLTEGPMAAVLRTGKPVLDVEMYIERADGSRMPLLVNFAPFTNAQGEVIGAITSCMDISERKQAEALREELLESERHARLKVEEAGRMKDEFLATLSHELRTPLNAIIGWTEILRENSSDAQEVEQGLSIIYRSAKAQAVLIEDMLDMSRIVSGNLRIELHQVDLTEVAHLALATLQPAAEAKRIAVNLRIDPGIAPVRGDSTRLQQVIWNLCSNAIKFTPLDGSVELSLTRKDIWIEIRVTDTGQGIEPDFLPYVFQRFRQADGSSTRRHMGLGLGLAICKNLVELHGGTISVESAGEGKGASFIVQLPAVASPLDQRPTTTNLNPDVIELSGIDVLVVDDDRDACDLMQRLLVKHHANVEVVHSADQAMQLMEAKNFDVLVSDIGMPDKDGYAFMRELRTSNLRSSKSPAIAVTAFAHREDTARALQAGFDMHVAKPVNARQLLKAVWTLAFDRV